MDTSHEILQEAKVTLTGIEEEKSQWAELKRLSPYKGKAVYFIVFILTVLCASLIKHPGFLIPAVAVIFLLSAPFSFISKEQKREKLLLTIIKKEAPEFYQKLKDRGIAA
jgi:hypothetical protein